MLLDSLIEITFKLSYFVSNYRLSLVRDFFSYLKTFAMESDHLSTKSKSNSTLRMKPLWCIGSSSARTNDRIYRNRNLFRFIILIKLSCLRSERENRGVSSLTIVTSNLIRKLIRPRKLVVRFICRELKYSFSSFEVGNYSTVILV